MSLKLIALLIFVAVVSFELVRVGAVLPLIGGIAGFVYVACGLFGIRA